MKSHFKTSSGTRLPKTFAAISALLGLMTADTFAEVVKANYATGSEVAVVSESFDASGKSVDLGLSFAPAEHQNLTVIRNSAGAG